MKRPLRYGEGRDALIASAVYVVAERGLRGLTFRATAERAGVNNSLVARHFGTREALLAAALDWAVEQSIALTRLIEFSTEEGFAEALLASITSHPELHAFQYEMILEARRNPIFQPSVHHLYERYLAVTRESLQAMGVTDGLAEAAQYTFAALDGLVMQLIAGANEQAVRAAVRELWESLLQRANVTGGRY